MAKPPVQVMIAGGGIGGLTLGLMLHARGIACTIYEGAPRLRELGVGVNVLPHATAELGRWACCRGSTRWRFAPAS